jgi:ribosome maturation factor RimP
MGFRLVRVNVSKRDGGTVQIMVDKPEGATVTVEDCADISHRLSPLLDLNDPLSERYFLEVSTAGIDRMLVRASDFEDWAGYEARIELNEMVDGRRRFRGIIEGFEDGEVRLNAVLDEKEEPQTLGFALELIHDAKLVLTDELIRASLTKAKASGKQWAEGGEVDDLELENGSSRD